MAMSKRVTNAAPLRQRFSLEVSSSKTIPRRSRPRTIRGKRTAILRPDRCFERVLLSWAMGWVLISGVVGRPQRFRAGQSGGAALEKAVHAFENLAGRSRRMHDSTKLAAVPHAMSKP